jgi:hypothetical protein
MPNLGFFTFGANLGGDPVAICSEIQFAQLRQLRAVFGYPKGESDGGKEESFSLAELISPNNAKKDIEINIEPFNFNCPTLEECALKTAAGQITPSWLLSRLCTGTPHLKKLSLAITGCVHIKRRNLQVIEEKF